MVVVGVGVGGVKSFSCKTQTKVRLGYVEWKLGWGFDNNQVTLWPNLQAEDKQVWPEWGKKSY